MIRQLFGVPAGVQTFTHRVQLALLFLIRLTLFVAIIWAATAHDWENFGVSLLAIGSTYVPGFVERRYRVFLPIEFHLVIVAFLYVSLFLGEVGNAYERFWWWDIMLHTSSGVALGFIGFLILYVLRVQQRLQMSSWLIGFFSFCVALAGGAMWEIIEFSIDQLFTAHMQRNNGDTMHDLIVDAFGALFIVLLATAYLRKGRSPLAHAVNNFVQLNPRLFKKDSPRL